RDLKVVPAVSVAVSPDLLVYPESVASLTRDLTITITNNRKGAVRGTVSLEGAAAWKTNPREAAFDLRRKGEQQSVTVSVARDGATQDARLSASARLADGGEYRYGYQRLSYPHIESRLLARRATARAVPIEVKVAPGLKVGYIEGAGDDFANALKRLDVDVHFIDPRE